MKARGLHVQVQKFDPYLNVDAGTSLATGIYSIKLGTGAATLVGTYNGTLSGFATAYTGASVSTALSGGTERVAYRIGWSLPSSVTDNTLQSSSAVAELDWEVQ